MTASRRDPLSNSSSPRLRWRAGILSASLAGAMLAACHAGLPAEPPGADPADPAAASAPYQIQPNPYETSAFAGEQAPRADEHAGHGNMNHGSKAEGQAGHEHMGHGSNAGAQQATPAAPTGHEHMGHGADAGRNQAAPATPAQPKHTGHGANAAGKQAPAPTEPEHAGHGATEKKSAADSDAMPPNMHKQPEPPR